jgi:CheY-like chemotaxis protein
LVGGALFFAKLVSARPAATLLHPAILDYFADERIEGDSKMHTDLNERQRQMANEDPEVRRLVSAVMLREMDLESVRDARRQARRTAKHVDVCLVEDDQSVVSMVQILVESAGHDLLSVDSCEGAILALRYTRPRLLLVDLGLPDRSGLEIARVVRGWYDYPHIPIVALTASAERAGAAWRAGFSGFIAKPFVPKTFQTMVKSWVLALAN